MSFEVFAGTNWIKSPERGNGRRDKRHLFFGAASRDLNIVTHVTNVKEVYLYTRSKSRHPGLRTAAKAGTWPDSGERTPTSGTRRADVRRADVRRAYGV